MKIGDHVYAMGQAIGVQMDAKYTEDNGLLVGDLISYRREICVGHAPVDDRTPCIVLGWVTLYEGRREMPESDLESGWVDQPYLTVTNSVKVWRVQPLSRDGRWRKPFDIFEEQAKPV